MTGLAMEGMAFFLLFIFISQCRLETKFLLSLQGHCDWVKWMCIPLKELCTSLASVFGLACVGQSALAKIIPWVCASFCEGTWDNLQSQGVECLPRRVVAGVLPRSGLLLWGRRGRKYNAKYGKIGTAKCRFYVPSSIGPQPWRKKNPAAAIVCVCVCVVVVHVCIFWVYTCVVGEVKSGGMKKSQWHGKNQLR